MLQIDLRSRAKNSLDQLLAAHFEAEHGDGLADVHRNVLRDIHCQCGLPHARSCRNDDHLGRMKPACHPVQLNKSSRQTGHRTPILIQFFDLFDRLHHEIFGGNNLRFDVFSSDRKNLFLCVVQKRLDFPLLIVALSGKLVAREDQPTQDVLLADDINVVAGVCRGRNKAVKSAQIFRTADLFQLIPIFESLLERDEIDWLTLITELKDQAVNNFVGRNVERFGPKAQNANVGYVAGRKEQRTEDTFFTILAEWQGSRNLSRCG